MLIILPEAPPVSGVTTWARRLSTGLAARGRRVGVVVHGESRFDVPPGVSLHRVDPGVHVRRFDADLDAIVECYAGVIEAEFQDRDGPVVISPNLLGDCYGAAAGLTRVLGDRVRLIGWAHSDNAYDEAVLRHYGPCLHATVGVSGYLARRLEGVGELGACAVPYGVEVQKSCPRRQGMDGRALRLLYAGRLEHGQKRMGALVHLADGLRASAVRFELVICGDGEAGEELESAFGDDDRICFTGQLGADDMAARMCHADALVLCSRYEGLSVAMLEAMAAGCVPVVTRVRSGASEAVIDNKTGLLIGVGADACVREVGLEMARRIAAVEPEQWGRMSRAAHDYAGEHYGLSRHIDTVERLIDKVCAAPGIVWPADAPLRYPSVGSGAGARLGALLEELHGRRVAVHGTGRHTLEIRDQLAPMIEAGDIVVFTDDNSAGDVMLFGLPIVQPEHAAHFGVTDVVISSRIHESSIWSRRAVYETAGIRIHRLYSA